MPLPWKKKKSGGGGGTGGRISRLMADFQSPSKRGGSLVVETGFPTSLIDLFVKNRDRMNKSSKRSKREKQQQQQQQGPNIEAPTVPLVDDDLEVFTSEEEVDRASLNRRSQTSSSSAVEDQDEEERDGVDSEAVDPSEEDLLDQRPDRLCSLFLAIPMVVILGLLAMFTKWLVMGATIAAFLLGFGEFILGSPVADSLKPCLIRSNDKKSKPKMKSTGSPSNYQPVKSVTTTGLKQVAGEIQVSVSKSEVDAENQVQDGLNQTNNAEVITMGGEDVVNEDQAGRRSKLRSKIMKKIVPNKIRNQKKKGEGDGSRSRI